MRRLLTLALVLCLSLPLAAQSRYERHEAHIQEARFAELSKEWAKAIDHYQKALELNPAKADTWHRLAEVHADAEQWDEAIAAYKKAKALGHGYPWSISAAIARSHAQAERADDAFAWLEKAMSEGHRNASLLRRNEAFAELKSDPRWAQIFGPESADEVSRIEGWRLDLAHLLRELDRRHYDPYRKHNRAEFDAKAAALHREIPTLTDEQVAVRLMEITTMAGDGHTRLLPGFVRGPEAESLPLRLYWMEEGIFVSMAGQEHADHIGAEVTAVNGVPIMEAIETIRPIIFRDNEMGLRSLGVTLLCYPGILRGLGMGGSGSEITLSLLKDGQKQEAVVTAVKGADRTGWTTLNGPGDPWARARLNDAYWYEVLEEEKALYLQYNGVRSVPGNPFRRFVAEVFDRIENDEDIEALILDIRWNGGGNSFLFRPLVNAIIGSKKINQRGKLYVITGRTTFSAAMNFAVDLEMRTEAMFAGEPTGASPNFIGETVAVTLPYSGMSGSISDLHWVRSWPMDHRTWIAPDFYEPPRVADILAGRDAPKEAILEHLRSQR